MITLTPDEKIIKVIRRHWFVILIQTLGLFILLVIPFIAYLFAQGKEIFLGEEGVIILLSTPVLTFIGMTWVLIIWLRFFHAWTDHYLDVWIVTDKRIIDIEQKGFFSREVASFRLERLQDVTTEVHGIVATLLDFGDVHVQTAGDDQDFIIRGAGKPKQLKELILAESDKYLEEIRAGGSNL